MLKSGKIVFTVSRCIHNLPMESETTDVIIFESSDNGETWSDPIITPLKGLVPDKLTELDNGRLLLSAHRAVESGRLVQYLIYSDDSGDSWSPEIVMADDPRYDLCEVSMLPLGNGTIVSFFRVNNVYKDMVIKVTSGDTQLCAFKREHMAPGEMEKITIPKVLLDKASDEITVSVEHQ